MGQSRGYQNIGRIFPLLAPGTTRGSLVFYLYLQIWWLSSLLTIRWLTAAAGRHLELDNYVKIRTRQFSNLVARE